MSWLVLISDPLRRGRAVVTSILLAGCLSLILGVVSAPDARGASVVDTSFSAGARINSDIRATAVVELGGVKKFLIGGVFTNAGGSGNNYVALMNRDGTVDTSFNPGSKLNGSVLFVSQIEVGGSKKFLVGGVFTNAGGGGNNRVVLFNLNGTIDASFSPGNALGGDALSFAEVDVGGVKKFLIGGSFINAGGTGRNYAVIFNQDGTIYPDFNIGNSLNEKVVAITEVVVGGSKKYFFSGGFTNAAGTGNDRVALFNLDGTVDPNFNSGTKVNGVIHNAVSFESDGGRKLVVVGDFTAAGGVDNSRAVMFNMNGSVDANFKPGSLLTGGNGNPRSAASFEINGVRKILIGGAFTGSAGNNLLVLNADGSVDSSATPTGLINNVVRSLTVLDLPLGGKQVLAAGNFTNVGATGNDRMVLLEEVSGSVRASIDSNKLDFDPVQYNLSSQNTTATTELTVSNDREVAYLPVRKNWQVSMQVSDLTSPGNASVPAANLSLNAINDLEKISGDAISNDPPDQAGPYVKAVSEGVPLNEPVSVMWAFAGHGHGEYQARVALNLLVPAQAKPGTYSGTITITTTTD